MTHAPRAPRRAEEAIEAHILSLVRYTPVMRSIIALALVITLVTGCGAPTDAATVDPLAGELFPVDDGGAYLVVPGRGVWYVAQERRTRVEALGADVVWQIVSKRGGGAYALAGDDVWHLQGAKAERVEQPAP